MPHASLLYKSLALLCSLPVFLLVVEVLAVICHCGMSKKGGLLLKCHLESKEQPAEQDLFISLLVGQTTHLERYTEDETWQCTS